MKINSLETIEYILRLVVFMTFLGHGMVAYFGNAGWLGYLLTAGFSLENANDVLPLIGVLDMVVALIILLKPLKYVVLWAVIWAFSTALIRPLSGESVWAFVERGANWGAPFALFLLLQYQKNTISE
jgi:hypothetical protein